MNGFDRTRVSRLGPLALGALFVVAACSSGGAAATAAPTQASAAPIPATAAPTQASAPPAVASPAGPTMVAMGTFHDVDGTASGTAALKHLADGSFVVVFEDFAIASAAHTNVVLLPVKDVKADKDVDKTAIVDLGTLKGTSGMQDYPVPSSADAMGLHTVVLWDTEMAHAVAAAPLQ